MSEEKNENNLAAPPPSEGDEEKLFSDEVFKDDLEFEDNIKIDNLPL